MNLAVNTHSHLRRDVGVRKLPLVGGSLVPCSRAPGQCSENVLSPFLPPFHFSVALPLWTWTRNLPSPEEPLIPSILKYSRDSSLTTLIITLLLTIKMKIIQRQQSSNTILVSKYLPLNSFGLILRCLKLVDPLLDPRWGSPDLQSCSKKKCPLRDSVIYFDKTS